MSGLSRSRRPAHSPVVRASGPSGPAATHGPSQQEQPPQAQGDALPTLSALGLGADQEQPPAEDAGPEPALDAPDQVFRAVRARADAGPLPIEDYARLERVSADEPRLAPLCDRLMNSELERRFWPDALDRSTGVAALGEIYGSLRGRCRPIVEDFAGSHLMILEMDPAAATEEQLQAAHALGKVFPGLAERADELGLAATLARFSDDELPVGVATDPPTGAAEAPTDGPEAEVGPAQVPKADPTAPIPEAAPVLGRESFGAFVRELVDAKQHAEVARNEAQSTVKHLGQLQQIRGTAKADNDRVEGAMNDASDTIKKEGQSAFDKAKTWHGKLFVVATKSLEVATAAYSATSVLDNLSKLAAPANLDGANGAVDMIGKLTGVADVFKPADMSLHKKMLAVSGELQGSIESLQAMLGASEKLEVVDHLIASVTSMKHHAEDHHGAMDMLVGHTLSAEQTKAIADTSVASETRTCLGAARNGQRIAANRIGAEDAVGEQANQANTAVSGALSAFDMEPELAGEVTLVGHPSELLVESADQPYDSELRAVVDVSEQSMEVVMLQGQTERARDALGAMKGVKKEAVAGMFSTSMDIGYALSRVDGINQSADNLSVTQVTYTGEDGSETSKVDGYGLRNPDQVIQAEGFALLAGWEAPTEQVRIRSSSLASMNGVYANPHGSYSFDVAYSKYKVSRHEGRARIPVINGERHLQRPHDEVVWPGENEPERESFMFGCTSFPAAWERILDLQQFGLRMYPGDDLRI